MAQNYLLSFIAGAALALLVGVGAALYFFKSFKERLKKYAAELAEGNIYFKSKGLDTFFGELKSNINSLAEEIESNYRRFLSGSLYNSPFEEKFGGVFKNMLLTSEVFLNGARAFLDDFSAPVIILDPNFNVTYLNKAAAKYTAKDSNTGKSFYCCFDLADERISAVRDAAATRETASSKTQLFAGEKVFEVSCAATPYLDENGDLTAIIVYIIDYTDVYATNKFAGIYKEFEEKRVRKLVESIDSYMKADSAMSGFDFFVKQRI